MTINLGTETLTFNQVLGPAMEVKTKEEAREYFNAVVEYQMNFTSDRKEAERIARVNIGYWAGYYDSKTQERVYKLYGFRHPILG